MAAPSLRWALAAAGLAGAGRRRLDAHHAPGQRHGAPPAGTGGKVVVLTPVVLVVVVVVVAVVAAERSSRT
jgi:hypothetical protein